MRRRFHLQNTSQIQNADQKYLNENSRFRPTARRILASHIIKYHYRNNFFGQNRVYIIFIVDIIKSL